MNTNKIRLINQYSDEESLFNNISKPSNIKNIGKAYKGIESIPDYKELILNGSLLDAVIMHSFMIVPNIKQQESLLESH